MKKNIDTETNKVLNEILKNTNKENYAPMPSYVKHEICNKLKTNEKSLEYHIKILKQNKIIEETIIETYEEYKLTTYKIKKGIKKVKPKISKQTN